MANKCWHSGRAINALCPKTPPHPTKKRPTENTRHVGRQPDVRRAPQLCAGVISFRKSSQGPHARARAFGWKSSRIASVRVLCVFARRSRRQLRHHITGAAARLFTSNICDTNAYLIGTLWSSQFQRKMRARSREITKMIYHWQTVFVRFVRRPREPLRVMDANVGALNYRSGFLLLLCLLLSSLGNVCCSARVCVCV